MDFHGLTRRELQALCKKNKIPANMANVAMADALKALEKVEGIEEFMQPSRSGTAQSSTESESLAMSEVTSPFVPPTAGRSTRRRNFVKEELETVNSISRTRRTTQKTRVKEADESQADAIETPALVARKKCHMASACRKMDSQLKECVEEDKKDVSMTPALLGVTSRRRRVEESAVKRVYSTRRSVRLAEKNVEMLNEVENEESELFKKELLSKDGENEEMNLKEGLDDFNELSGITDVDAITTMEENSENKDNSEVVSDQNQDISIGKEIKFGSTAEGEGCINFETEAELDGEKCDNKEDTCGENTVMPLNVSNEVQQSDESHDVCTSGIEIIVEKTEELSTEKDAGCQDEAADFVENVFLENKDNFAAGFRDENNDKDIDFEDVPDFNVTLVNFTELRLQEATKEVSPGRMLGDVAEADSDFIDHLAIPAQFHKDEPDQIEILLLEESQKAADPVPSDAQPYGGEAAGGNALASIKNSPSKQLGAEDVPFHSASLDMNADSPEHIPTPGFAGLDSHLIVQPICLTPSKNSASKASITMKRMTGFSDNKENIGSCSKLVLIEDRAKIAKNTVENVGNLHELSVRKLSKMVKEKLEITKKSSRNEHGNEALPRPALQALPENRLVDETQN
ncbi:hypothetical protein Pfo_027961 [Paulownia fortunei]|nr:hypothetical protein Pfo_027961 [Paulownia fortunei]